MGSRKPGRQKLMELLLFLRKKKVPFGVGLGSARDPPPRGKGRIENHREAIDC